MSIELAVLGSGAFAAGLIDAVVGGGGLIQIPLLLAVFPSTPIAVLFGTNKLASIVGTGGAAIHYARRLDIPKQIALPATLAALPGAALGAMAVSLLPPASVRPLVFVLLLLVGLYTFFKPDFGRLEGNGRIRHGVPWFSALLGFLLGFYDGFFGPGTGSFLIFGFVALFGLDMLHASASSKFVNLATNFAALSYFILQDSVMWKVGLVMAACNLVGGQLGARLSLRHGSRFVRLMLLVIVSVLLCKLGWDLFSK
jgi:uncharacterized protein